MNFGKKRALTKRKMSPGPETEMWNEDRPEPESPCGGAESDVKETVKRKSRNLSEKKRRDQFNMLVNELCAMVSNNRKMDKTTVIKTAIQVIEANKAMADEQKSREIHEHWKPSFMSNNEFVHLMLEAIDGFLMSVAVTGRLLYVSESVTALLGHLPESLVGKSLMDFIHVSDRARVNSAFAKHPMSQQGYDFIHPQFSDYHVRTSFHMRCGGGGSADDAPLYELVELQGTYRKFDPETAGIADVMCDMCLCCTVRLSSSRIIRELPAMDDVCKEFTSRHNLEWKFLFLDHRGPPVIGYLPFEVLGTSGYDYVHPDDLEKLARNHEQLMQSGEGKSCCYRFMTKGQQWIWLQSRYYITYHQWNSKPEFVVCTNTVVSYLDVRAELQKDNSNEAVPRQTAESSSGSRMAAVPEHAESPSGDTSWEPTSTTWPADPGTPTSTEKMPTRQECTDQQPCPSTSGIQDSCVKSSKRDLDRMRSEDNTPSMRTLEALRKEIMVKRGTVTGQKLLKNVMAKKLQMQKEKTLSGYSQQRVIASQQPHPANKQSSDSSQQPEVSSQQLQFDSHQPQFGDQQQSQVNNQQSHFPDQQSQISSQQSHFLDQQSQITSQQSHFSDQQSQVTNQQPHFADQQSQVTSQQSHFADQQSHFADQQSQFTEQQSQFTGQQSQFADQQSHIVSQHFKVALEQSIVASPEPHVTERQSAVGQSVRHSAGQSVHQPAGQSVHQPAGQSVHQPAGQSVHQSAGQSVHQPAGQSVHQSAGQSVHQPAEQSLQQLNQQQTVQIKMEGTAAPHQMMPQTGAAAYRFDALMGSVSSKCQSPDIVVSFPSLVATSSASDTMMSSQSPVQINSIQQHLQLQLLEKYRQLQTALIKQQQELHRISEQLLLTSQFPSPGSLQNRDLSSVLKPSLDMDTSLACLPLLGQYQALPSSSSSSHLLLQPPCTSSQQQQQLPVSSQPFSQPSSLAHSLSLTSLDVMDLQGSPMSMMFAQDPLIPCPEPPAGQDSLLPSPDDAFTGADSQPLAQLPFDAAHSPDSPSDLFGTQS